ncbi:MAG: SpoIIE family protein phosphatase [Armatimonadetes bacterium]|nr:SpoIIE family protein phosphatase [Armatimonadota bacterium]
MPNGSLEKTQESQRHIAYLEALSRIQREIASQQTLEAVLDTIVRSAIDTVGKAACAVLLLDPDEQTLTCKASKGVFCSESDKKFPHNMYSLTERVLQTKKMVMIADTRKESDLRLPILENGLSPGAAISSPILVGEDQVVGVLAVYFDEPHTLSEEELHWLNVIAGSVGVSVRNAETYSEVVKQRTWLDAVLRIVPSAVLISRKPGDRLTLANQKTEQLLGRKPNLGQPLMEMPAEYGISRPDGSPFLPDEFPLYRSSAHGETSDLVEMMVTRPYGERSFVQGSAAPIYDEKGSILGAVGELEDITFLKNVQETLEKALAKECYLYEILQKSLIPDIPDYKDGLMIGSAYSSAFAEDYMGGDFFDLFSLKPGQVSIVIGDVSGKGVRAAVLTALVKYTLRAYAYEDPSPRRLIEKLNDVVASETANDDFTTLFYGLWSAKEQSLAFVSAGHEPPLYIECSESGVKELSAVGIPLGVFPGVVYEEHDLRLSAGDRLLLYTDGVTEARRDKDFFGLEALKDFFVAKRHEFPSEFSAQLMDCLKEFSSGHLRDDVALMLICATPNNSPSNAIS